MKQTMGSKLKKLWNKTVFSDMIKQKKENEQIRREAREEARKEAIKKVKNGLKQEYMEEEMAKIKGKKKGEGMKKFAEAMGSKSEVSVMDKMTGKANTQGQNIIDKLGMGNNIASDDKINRMLGKTDKQVLSNEKIGELGSIEHNTFKTTDKMTKKMPKGDKGFFDDKLKKMLE